jgi:hypothetical protein
MFKTIAIPGGSLALIALKLVTFTPSAHAPCNVELSAADPEEKLSSSVTEAFNAMA